MRNGQQETWTYDNVTNIFADARQQNPLAHIPPSQDKPQSFSIKNNPHKFNRQFNLLEIMLGAKCNFDCIYCSQRTFRDNVYSSSPKDVDRFCSLLTELKIIPDSIQLWGGEPLVYWKTIQVLVPKLRDMYGNIEISFPTNGSLLTREKIDFIKQWDLRFWISHDGHHDEGRQYGGHKDILDDQTVVDAINYAHEVLKPGAISFKATYTHGNCNSEQIVRFFKTNVNKDAKVSLNNVVICHDSTNPISVASSKLDEHDLSTLEESLFNALNGGDCDFSSKQTRDGLINKFINRLPIETVGAECGNPFGASVCVTLDGVLQRCHNFGPYQDRRTLRQVIENNAHIDGFYSFSDRTTNCKDCLVVHSCQGMCPGIDNKCAELSCKNAYAHHYAVFKAALASLFGVYLIGIEK